MLKKIGYIIIASLLTLSTMGFVISRHYCNFMLVSVTIDVPADRCCDGMDGNCCHNENEYIVLKTDYALPLIQQITVAEIDVFSLGFNTLAENKPALATQSNRIDLIFPRPEKNKSISLIQSFLL